MSKVSVFKFEKGKYSIFEQFAVYIAIFLYFFLVGGVGLWGTYHYSPILNWNEGYTTMIISLIFIFVNITLAFIVAGMQLSIGGPKTQDMKHLEWLDWILILILAINSAMIYYFLIYNMERMQYWAFMAMVVVLSGGILIWGKKLRTDQKSA